LAFFIKYTPGASGKSASLWRMAGAISKTLTPSFATKSLESWETVYTGTLAK
jgi:hypothetical protein